MMYLNPKNYGFEHFIIRFNNKNYKVSKIGFIFSNAWEAYVISVCEICKNSKTRQHCFALKSMPDSDAAIKVIFKSLKTGGVLDLNGYI